MSMMLRSQAFHAWLVLVAITLLSWYLSSVDTSQPGVRGDATAVYSIAVLVVGFVKAWTVMRYFMEARRGPGWLKVVCDVWLFAVAAAIISLYPLGLW